MKETLEKLQLWFWCSVIGLFVLLIIAGGAALVYVGVKEIALSQISKDWPSTSGKVISSSVEEKASKRTGTSGKDSMVSYCYSADIRYEYAVNSERFDNDTVTFGGYGSCDESNAKLEVSRYPVGKVVKVYYKPDDPNESVLVKGAIGSAAVLKVLVGPALMLLGLGIVVLAYVVSRKKTGNNR